MSKIKELEKEINSLRMANSFLQEALRKQEKNWQTRIYMEERKCIAATKKHKTAE